MKLVSWIKNQCRMVPRRETSNTGLLFGVIFSLISVFLIGGGFLTPLDDYLTALILQYGYDEPEVQEQILIVKKDQATSELIGRNPGRAEFASIISFLGSTQKVKRRLGGARKFTFFSISIGNFNLASPVVDDSYLDLTGGRRVIDEYFNNSEVQHEEYSSLIKIESKLFAPNGGNVLRALAGPGGRFIIPTLGLNLDNDELSFIDLEMEYALANNKKPPFERSLRKLRSILEVPWQSRTHEMIETIKEESEKISESIMERWANLFENIFYSSLDVDLQLFPDENTVLNFALAVNIDGIPPEYYVPPASVIAFDFILQGEKNPAVDAELEDAIEKAGSSVVLSAHTKIEEDFVVDPTYQIATVGQSLRELNRRNLVTRLIMPAKKFIKPSVKLGMIDIAQGNKGYVTEIPLFTLIPSEKRLAPAFSLVTAMEALDQKSPNIATQSYIAEMNKELERIYPMVAAGKFRGDLTILDRTIPLNDQGRMLIKFIGSTQKNRFRHAAIPSVSFYECFSDDYIDKIKKEVGPKARSRLAKAHVRTLDFHANKSGKIALAGPFELSDFDFYPTPLTYKTPYAPQEEPLMGIEIHANAVLNILNNRYLRHPSAWQTLFAVFTTTILLGLVLDFLSPTFGALVTGLFLYGIFYYGYYSYHQLGQVFYFSSMLISYPAIWSFSTLVNYLRQRARAQETKNMFSRFVAADVVQYMLDNPELVKPGGQKVELTIFFSDVAGFTSISEALTPEELVVLLNEYLGAMTDLLFEYGGTLDKFIGDAVMAFWNYPKAQEDHAERACLCASAMQRKINELQIGWAERGLPRVSARAGINSAKVVVGYMGSSKAQMNFTCMGDGVNLASRLEGANKEYGTNLMISDATYQKAKNKVTARFLDFLAVKGKKEPVKVYELVCEKGNEPPGWAELAEMYDAAIQLHLDRKWDEAIATFEKILLRWPEDGPSKTYLSRCHEYIHNPPPEDWDGRYILTHK